MATKFYKKFTPSLGVNIGGSSVIKFNTLDGIIGYFATAEESIQNAFKAHIEAGRFGMSEIAWPEFNDEYVKKKAVAPPLRKPWRDELSNQTVRHGSTISPEVQRSVAVVREPGYRISDPEPEPAKPSSSPSEPAPVVAFQPTTGRRSQ